jgi:hypothetical protein
MPVFRRTFSEATWGAFEALVSGESVAMADGVPVYPSGRVAILSGYGSREANNYAFVLDGGDLRTAETPVRSSLGLHLVSVRLAASRVRVEARRQDGVYRVNMTPLGESETFRDFSFWLHPWSPPVQRIHVQLSDGVLPRLRRLWYGGELESGERRFVMTNYEPDVLDMIDVPYTVDTRDEPMHCGLFVFTYGVDPTRIETLVLAGGHDQEWEGRASGTLRVPRNLLADRVLLFNDPYCSDHVPQYGDRYGLLEGPFEEKTPLHFVIDRMW